MRLRPWQVSAGLVGLALLAAWTIAAENRDEILTRRRAVLDRIIKSTPQPDAPPSDGVFIKTMVQSGKAKRALELGTSNGYKSIWLGWGLEETGGHLWTLEIDAGRAKVARENLKEAGLLDSVVTSIEGDAFKEIPKLEGQFDLILLDAWKEDYDEFFEVLFPRLAEGGVLLAHNAITRAADIKPYLDIVLKHPELDTVIVKTTLAPAQFKQEMENEKTRRAIDGFVISYKKRKR